MTHTQWLWLIAYVGWVVSYLISLLRVRLKSLRSLLTMILSASSLLLFSGVALRALAVQYHRILTYEKVAMWIIALVTLGLIIFTWVILRGKAKAENRQPGPLQSPYVVRPDRLFQEVCRGDCNFRPIRNRSIFSSACMICYTGFIAD